jgi:hypothetical protein
MHKSLFISLAFLVVLPGCSAFKKSQTWQQVVDNRADRLAAAGKAGYPDKLHAVLAAQNVEHKIVTYQYRYKTRLREEAIGTGKAVLYRDTTTPESPWWAMDENTGFPVWVPNKSLDRQVSFFLRHDAEILAQQDFSGGSGGKSFDNAPQLTAPAATPRILAQTRKPDEKARRKARPMASAVVGATAGTSVSPGVRFAWLTSLEHRFDEKFRATHGTDFDRNSSADRQKMVELRQALASRNEEI